MRSYPGKKEGAEGRKVNASGLKRFKRGEVVPIRKKGRSQD